MLIFLNFTKNFIKNYTLSISFHYLCNQKSDIRLSKEGKLPAYPMARFNQSINQFKKSLEDLNNCLITVSNGTKQCKAS